MSGRTSTSRGDAQGGRGISATRVPDRSVPGPLLMIRPDMPAESGRITADRGSADVVNRHVAFNATRFLVRRPGTDPLAGLTVPKKAPASFSVGNMILFQPFRLGEGAREESARSARARRDAVPGPSPFDLTPPQRRKP